MKRCLVVYYFSKSNNHRYSREGKKKKKEKVHFIDMEEEIVCFREIVTSISYFLPWRVIDVLR